MKQARETLEHQSESGEILNIENDLKFLILDNIINTQCTQT